MPQLIYPISALLLSVAILLLGSGLLGTLIPLSAQAAGFSPTVIGLLGSSYFVGFLLGCIFTPNLIRRVGHIRAFSAFTSVATISAIIHGLVEAPILWTVLRLVVGFAFAALYMVIESWLNDRADSKSRGTVMGIYAVVNFGAIAIGQQFLRFGGEDSHWLFFVVALCAASAILPVTLTRNEAPPLPPAAKLPLKQLLAISPVGVVGCFLNGVSAGPFWSFGPIYAHDNGLGLGDIALFMSLPIIAGALTAWPLGLISDHIDRRAVIAGAWGAVMIVGAALAALSPSGNILFMMIFLFGAAMFPINSLYVAHVNDVMTTGDRIAISSGLILLYGIGAAISPLIAGRVIAWMGAGGLFAYIGLIAAVGMGFTLYRMRVGVHQPAVEDREPFVLLPRSTQGAVDLDPRTEDGEVNADQSGDTETQGPQEEALAERPNPAP